MIFIIPVLTKSILFIESNCFQKQGHFAGIRVYNFSQLVKNMKINYWVTLCNINHWFTIVILNELIAHYQQVVDENSTVQVVLFFDQALRFKFNCFQVDVF